jgi:hypothetical protein
MRAVKNKTTTTDFKLRKTKLKKYKKQFYFKLEWYYYFRANHILFTLFCIFANEKCFERFRTIKYYTHIKKNLTTLIIYL